MQNPAFWREPKAAAKLSQELASLKKEVESFENLEKELKTLRELAAEEEENKAPRASPRHPGGAVAPAGAPAERNPAPKTTIHPRASPWSSGAVDKFSKEFAEFEKKIRDWERKVFFAGKYDSGNAVISVYAGAGGKDAEDWAALLFKMYRRFAERKNWDVKIIHEHWGEYRGPAGQGIKNATLLVKGKFAYGHLKKESGVHRLVRISPFSASQLRHTSFALVDVMPEFVAPEEVEIRPEDLKIDFFRSSGPGGQNVNKRETAVRITHLPTGAQAASQAERSQERNREIALEILRAELYETQIRRREEERRGVRQEKKSIEWGNQIRSYVMHPYQIVKDHRTNFETSQIEKVLDGELDEFIEAEIKQNAKL